LTVESERVLRQFWLMPLIHCKDLAVQQAARPLFERFSHQRTADFARRYHDSAADGLGSPAAASGLSGAAC